MPKTKPANGENHTEQNGNGVTKVRKPRLMKENPSKLVRDPKKHLLMKKRKAIFKDRVATPVYLSKSPIIRNVSELLEEKSGFRVFMSKDFKDSLIISTDNILHEILDRASELCVHSKKSILTVDHVKDAAKTLYGKEITFEF